MPVQADSVSQVPRRPRGRPKAEDLAALEARLIQVGSELFFGKGYGTTTMSEVAALARVSKTTLYSRFPSKAALFRAIVAAQIERWGLGAEHTPIPDDAALEEVLLAYGGILLRAATSPDFVHLNRLMHGESGRFPELAESAAARIDLGCRFLADHIAASAERDSIPCRDPAAAAELFMMMLMGWSSAMVVTNRSPAPEERRTVLERIVRTFLSSRSSW